MTPADRGGQGCRHRPGMAVDKWRGQWSLIRRHGILSYGCMFSVSVELYCTCTGLYIIMYIRAKCTREFYRYPL